MNNVVGKFEQYVRSRDALNKVRQASNPAWQVQTLDLYLPIDCSANVPLSNGADLFLELCPIGIFFPCVVVPYSNG